MSRDRNFDDLTGRFRNNIYNTPKGQIRLAILKEDLQTILPTDRPLRILDAGCGPGLLSLWLAEQGHELVLSDVSAEMLDQARSLFEEKRLQARATFIQAPVQELQQLDEEPFDLILFHAVLEWLAEPAAGLACLMPLLAGGGHLSLLYYNRNSIVFRNMLRGNFRKVLSGDFSGHPGGLTPSHPIDPAELDDWLSRLPLHRITTTGMRVVYDYLSPQLQKQRSLQDILQMERLICRNPDFVHLGRYVHVLLGRTSDIVSDE